MNILVAVASKHGATRGIAEAVADELRTANFSVDLQAVDDVTSLAPYDAVVFGSAIYTGNWLPEARHFAERFRTELAKLPLWVFSSGPIGAENPQPHDDPAKLAAPLGGIALRDHRVFVGKLDRENLGFAERMLAKIVNSPAGDFRDWDAIRAWAHEIAGALQPTEAVAPAE